MKQVAPWYLVKVFAVGCKVQIFVAILKFFSNKKLGGLLWENKS